MGRVNDSLTRAKSIHYPCATNRRATDVVLREDISTARILELIEYDPVIPNIILDGVIIQPRTLPVPKVQVRFLIPSSCQRLKGEVFWRADISEQERVQFITENLVGRHCQVGDRGIVWIQQAETLVSKGVR